MIRALSLENFKTFKHSRVEFSGLTLVLGSNGVGKSNLFDALRFLKSVGEGQTIRDALEGHVTSSQTAPSVPGIRGGAVGIPSFGSGSSEFRLVVEIISGKSRIVYEIKVDTKSYRVVSEELTDSQHPGSYVYSTHPETGPIDQSPDSPVITARFHKAARGLNPKRDFSPYEPILGQFRDRKAESRLNEGVADVVRAELRSLKPLELRPEVLRQYAPLGRSELGEHGENFAAVVVSLKAEADFAVGRRRRQRKEPQLGLAIPDQVGTPPLPTTPAEAAALESDEEVSEAEARLSSIRSWMNELTPRPVTELGFERAPTGEAIFALREEGHDGWVSARSLSDGTLRFAALTFAALGARDRTTLVVEEIENGINPARLALLMDMLQQVSRTYPDLQIIASTHSPGLLDYASKATTDSSVVIGWDTEMLCSRPVLIKDIGAIAKLGDEISLGDLQAEGWLQMAAGK